MGLRDDLIKIKQENEKVLVVGLGISGVETARFLRRVGISAVCVERSDEARFVKNSKFKDAPAELRAAGVDVYFEVDGEGVSRYLDKVKLAVISPGVSLESAVIGALKRRNVPLVSELELGVELLDVPTLMITGSNGKSTTVSLLQHLLTASGIQSRLCGNVGVPVVAELESSILSGVVSRPQFLVVEASSYQLEACRRIKPKLAALLNISDNHLERHGTLQRYIEAKARAFAHQGESDFALLNADDSAVFALRGRIPGKVVPFGTRLSLNQYDFGARVDYDPNKDLDSVTLRIEGMEEEYPTNSVHLLGQHNRLNIAAALLMARLSGAEPGALVSGLASFRPLEHRLEFVGRVNGAHIINDSKSTTVAASLAAVRSVAEAFPECRLMVLFGGLAKAGSWDSLMSALLELKGRLRPIVCFGKDGNLIANQCRRYNLPCDVVPSLARAVEVSLANAQENELILLTPGCASFDEFTDFEERGNVFKSLVKAHKFFVASA
ncbi:MAG: UDP-N-acetylmuramoyl-L-alanine--D-glutamate ligase [Oligoflexia bacterium]|nr:UDP-N-acetylmuramoyl-L-alanine--D-glutamate ligase [Oligoflexia bacterium]